MSTMPVQAFEGMNAEAMRENVIEAVRLLKTLANESRLTIMCILSEGELSVGALNAHVPGSQSALSQHLAVLRDHDLVQTRRDGQTIYYSLADSKAIPLIMQLHDIYCGDSAQVGTTG